MEGKEEEETVLKRKRSVEDTDLKDNKKIDLDSNNHIAMGKGEEQENNGLDGESEVLSSYVNCLKEAGAMFKSTKRQEFKSKSRSLKANSDRIKIQREEVSSLQRMLQEQLEKEKAKLVSSPVSVHQHSKRNDTLLMALSPFSSVYFQAITSVKLLIGEAWILGYSLKENEEVNVYSLPSHSLLRIKAGKGFEIQNITEETAENLGIPMSWIQSLSQKREEPAQLIIAAFRYCSPPMAKLLHVAGWPSLVKPQKNVTPFDQYGIFMINKENYTEYGLTVECWGNLVGCMSSMRKQDKGLRIILSGGKGTGKSTLFKYLVNGLLGPRGVLCLDLDPGQPELSLPTSISLSHVNRPLLGPGYAHLTTDSIEYSKKILLGATSPEFMMEKYMKAVQSLVKASENFGSMPLIVNTMGWSDGIGLDAMLDIIRIVQPTHVLQLISHKRHVNFRVNLDKETVMKQRGGVFTRPYDVQLNYKFFRLQALGSREDGQYSAAEVRELSILAHLSKIISMETGSERMSLKGIVKIQWSKVVLHVCNPEVPRERILQVMNASLVAFCKVNEKDIEVIAPHLPKHLAQDAKCSELIGWGIIRGIDPLTQELHLLTDLNEETINTSINAIIQPNFLLPQNAFDLFAGITGETPYMEYQPEGDAKNRTKDFAPKPRLY